MTTIATLSLSARCARTLLLSSVGAAALIAGQARAQDVAAVAADGAAGAADAREVAAFLSERLGLGDNALRHLSRATTWELGAPFAPEGVWELEGAEQALFYYSGSGARGADGRAALMSADGALVALDDVLAGVAAVGAERTVVVLESSFQGGAFTPPAGVTVVLAADAGQLAQRDSATGLGLFTVALLDGASTAADADGDGVVTVGEAADYGALALELWSAARPGRALQRPVIVGDEDVALLDAAAPAWTFTPPSGALDDAWLEAARAAWTAGGAGAGAARRAPVAGRDERASAPDLAPDTASDVRGSRSSRGSGAGVIGAGAAGLGVLALAAGGGGGGGGDTSPPPSPPTSPPPPPPVGSPGPDTYPEPEDGPLNAALTEDVELGAGDDLFNLGPDGAFGEHFVDGGEGDDTVALVGAFDAFSLGLLGDSAEIRRFEVLDVAGRTGGVVAAAASLSSIEDALLIDGEGVVDIVGGDAADLLAIAGALTGDVLLHDGRNELYVLGSLDGSATLGEDADLLAILEDGAVIGDVLLGGEDDRLILAGALDGDAFLGAGHDVFELGDGSALTGVADGGAGDDVFMLETGALAGSLDGGDGIGDRVVLGAGVAALDLGRLARIELLDMGAGALSLTGAGALTEVLGGAAADHLTLAGALTVHSVILEGGDDVLVLADGGELIGNAFLGTGADVLMLDGGTIAGFVDAGADTDVLVPFTNGATFDLSQVGDAAEYRAFEELFVGLRGAPIELTGANTSAIDVRGDADVEVITVSGTQTGNVDLLGGDDWLTLGVDGSVSGIVDGGEGQDTLVVTVTGPTYDLSQIGDTVGGPGFVSFENAGISSAGVLELTGESSFLRPVGVMGSEGEDIFTLSGNLTGEVNLAGGDDMLTVLWQLSGRADLGVGNDTYVLEGLQSANLLLGEGADLFIWGGGSIQSGAVDGGVGDDTIRLVAFNNYNLSDLNPSGLTPGFETLDISMAAAAFDLFGVNQAPIRVVGGDDAENLGIIGGGVLNGDIDLRGGADWLEFQSGVLNGNALLGEGNDTFALRDLADFTGFIDGGSDVGGGDNDTIWLGSVQTGFDLDLVGNDRTFRNFETLDAQAQAFGGSLTLSGSNASAIDVVGHLISEDDLTLTGTLTGNVSLAGGGDQLTLTAGSFHDGDVLMGAGDDVFLLAGGELFRGDFSGTVDGGAGDDTITVTLGAETTVRTTLDLSRLTGFETLNGNGPLRVTLTGSGSISDVTGGAEVDWVWLQNSTFTGDISLGGSQDSLHIFNGSLTGAALMGEGHDTVDFDRPTSLAGITVLDGGPGFDFLTVDIESGVMTLNGDTAVTGFEVLSKYGDGELIVEAPATFAAVEVRGGVLDFRGALDFTGALEWAELIPIVREAPIAVFNGGAFAARGTLTIPVGAGFNLSDGVYIADGYLSPGRIGVVDTLQIVAESPLATPVLGFHGGAGLLVDWGGDGVNDLVDAVDVTDGAGTGETFIDDLTVTFNVLEGGSIDDGDTAVLITSDTMSFGAGSPGDIGALGVPDGLTWFYTDEPFDTTRHALRVRFSANGAASDALAATTPQTLSGASLLTSPLAGGALDAAGGVAQSSFGFSGLGSRAAGWAPYGSDGARAGVTQRVFLTDVGGVQAQATANATRSFAGGEILGGRARAGFGTGVEEVVYLTEGDRSRDGMSGRTRAGYLAAYLGTEIAQWRVDAAVDAGLVSFRFDGAALGRVDTAGYRTRAEVVASRMTEIAGAPIGIDLGLRYADLGTDPYRRDDGLWTRGPTARFTAATAGVALGELWGFAPYARMSAAIDGEAEEQRLIGVRSAPTAGFALDASVGAVSEPYAEEAAKGEVRLNWRF